MCWVRRYWELWVGKHVKVQFQYCPSAQPFCGRLILPSPGRNQDPPKGLSCLPQTWRDPGIHEQPQAMSWQEAPPLPSSPFLVHVSSSSALSPSVSAHSFCFSLGPESFPAKPSSSPPHHVSPCAQSLEKLPAQNPSDWKFLGIICSTFKLISHPGQLGMCDPGEARQG